MAARIESLLRLLYGRETARTMLPRLRELMRRRGRQNGLALRAPPDLPLTERDALLISYGDQVQESGVTPLRTLCEFLEEHLQNIVSGVHLLPFYPWSSDDGFAVTDLFAMNPALGTWPDVRRIGDTFDLMFDAVFNHLSARSRWFQGFLEDDPAFRDFFVTVEGEPDLASVVRPRALPLLTEFNTAAGRKKVWTTFSDDQVDLNFKNPNVLLAVLDALLFYVTHGARFIRLDAIAYLWKQIGTPCIHLPQTHRIIQLMRAVLDEFAPGIRLITETNVPHADNLSYFGDGTNEAQLVYNFALPPLVLHSLAAGNAAKLSAWAARLKLPSDRVTFLNFLASHDGIGLNPARGILSEAEIESLVQRARDHGGFVSFKQNADGSKSPYELNITFFDALSNANDRDEPIETQVARFLVAQGIVLSLAGVPGIYFHSLFGSRNDRAGAESSGIARRINRQKLTRAELESDLADEFSLRARVFARYQRLLRTRRLEGAFDPRAAQRVLSVDQRVFALMRETPGGARRMLCMHNVTKETAHIKLALADVEAGHGWLDLLSKQGHYPDPDGKLTIELSPYQIFWARLEPKTGLKVADKPGQAGVAIAPNFPRERPRLTLRS